MWGCQQLMLLFQFFKMWMFQFQKIFIPQFQKMSMFPNPKKYLFPNSKKMPIFKFRKITISLKHNFKKLILILWIMIREHANKYGNIMLINVMKFDVLTLKIVHTNLLQRHTKKVESTIVAFKLLGLNIIQHGLNILLRKMQLIVYLALSFIIQMGLWDKIHSLLVDLVI